MPRSGATRAVGEREPSFRVASSRPAEGEKLMPQIDRRRHSDHMSNCFGVPGKANGRKQPAREADADAPHLGDSPELDKRKLACTPRRCGDDRIETRNIC